jgi:hypothetical protein
MMPPPPADYITKTRARSRSYSPEKMSNLKRKGDVRTYGKGKGKEVDSDDEIEVLGSSPGKPKRGDGESADIGRLTLRVGLEENHTLPKRSYVIQAEERLTLGRSSTW